MEEALTRRPSRGMITQVDMLKIIEGGQNAARAARGAIRNYSNEGKVFAQAERAGVDYEHAAWVIVSYVRAQGLEEVPALPEGWERKLPEDFEWPEGFIVGALATGDERKAAVKAICAEVNYRKTLATVAWRAATKQHSTYESEMTMAQSLLKAAQHEDRMATYQNEIGGSPGGY